MIKKSVINLNAPKSVVTTSIKEKILMPNPVLSGSSLSYPVQEPNLVLSGSMSYPVQEPNLVSTKEKSPWEKREKSWLDVDFEIGSFMED